MAGQRIDIMELKQLIRLKRDGNSNRKTADLLHVSRNTVNEYVRIFSAHGLTYEELMDLDDQSLHDLFPCITEVESHRFVTLSDQFTYFQRELKKPGCTIHTLWREYILKHPDGYMYSQFCYHFNQWRERVDCSIKLNHKAGEKLFIDFTGKKLSYVDKASGELIEVNVFVAILPSSGYTFVTATRTQSHFQSLARIALFVFASQSRKKKTCTGSSLPFGKVAGFTKFRAVRLFPLFEKKNFPTSSTRGRNTLSIFRINPAKMFKPCSSSNKRKRSTLN